MSEDRGLVYGAILDGDGGGRVVGWDEIRSWTPNEGPLWVHLQRGDPETERWLREDSGIDEFTVQALLEEDPRPRTATVGKGLLAIFRGVNMNPGSDPEDMVSVRLFVTAERCISVRTRMLLSIQSMRDDLAQGEGARTAPGVLARLAENLARRIGPVIQTIEDRMDGLEEKIGEARSADLRSLLRDLRREAIVLRRYLAPQRDAIARLPFEETTLLNTGQRGRLREVADITIRYVEDLDSIRDRAAVIQDELATQMSEQMNKTMYLLTVVATVMLPLGFITGLLGVNVGGIPGSSSPVAFALLCAILIGLVGLEVFILRRLRWI